MEKLLYDFVERSQDILGDNLVGIYLHGSLTMGGFNRDKSDIDLIVVVNNPLSYGEKRKYLDMIVGLNDRIEMSIVLRSACRPFIHPAPFELHYSIAHLDSYKADPDGYIERMTGTDRDLAAHFSVINTHGKRLFGEKISEKEPMLFSTPFFAFDGFVKTKDRYRSMFEMLCGTFEGRLGICASCEARPAKEIF